MYIYIYIYICTYASAFMMVETARGASGAASARCKRDRAHSDQGLSKYGQKRYYIVYMLL